MREKIICNPKTGKTIVSFLAILALVVIFLELLSMPARADIWQIQTVDQYGDKGSDNSIVLDSLGRPHISYRELDTWAFTNYLKYSFWNGTSWKVQYVDWTGDVGFNSSLALNSLDRPCISYHDKNYNLKYASWNGSSWQISTIINGGSSPSLVLDNSDRPHISYFKPYYVIINNLQVLKADLMYAYWDGQQWQFQTVERGGRVGEFNALALDHNGRPHIAYRDFGTASGKLKYAAWDGSAWQIQTVDEQGDAEKNPSLAMDSADHPCISYMGGDYSLKYATLVNGVWQFQIVDAKPGMYSLPNSLALDKQDRPHISYCDQFHVPVSLKYAAWDGNAWQIQTIDSIGSPGLSNSMALDSENRPHISYYESIDGTGGGALKYANALPVVWVTAPDSSASEKPVGGDTGIFRVWRSGSTASSLTVYFTMGGAAVNGSDYNTITNSVTIPAGSLSADVILTPIEHTICESDKTAVLTLTANSEYPIGTQNNATVTIHKNGCLPVITVTAPDDSASESGSDTGTLRISRTGSTASYLTVYISMTGSASNAVDYNMIWSSVNIPSGSSSADVVIRPIDNTSCTNDKTVILTPSANSSYILGTPGNAAVTIRDDV